MVARLNSSARVRRNVALVNRIRQGPCHDCRHTYPVEVMDFDHVQHPKVACVSYLARRGCPLPRLQAEIAKCQLVCANCHRTREVERSSRNGQCQRKFAVLLEYKDRPCFDCRRRFIPEVMDFDRDGSTSRESLSKLAARLPPSEFAVVLASLDLVCANCHRIRTTARFQRIQEEPMTYHRLLVRHQLLPDAQVCKGGRLSRSTLADDLRRMERDQASPDILQRYARQARVTPEQVQTLLKLFFGT